MLMRTLVIVLLPVLLALAQSLPETVPDGKSAAEYYELGQQYKKVGWPEQARECLSRCIKADPKGVGRQARTFMDCYLPRFPTTQEAVQMNVIGYNQMAQNDLAGATQTFLDCIKRYPRFEWPYGNLGFVYTQQGKLKEARKVLQQALKINPSYVNGWLHLAEACQQDSDPGGARDAVNQALRCDPSNAAAQRLQSQLRQ